MANVDYVFTPEQFQLQGNEYARLRAGQMGLGEEEIKQGRVVKVSCGISDDWPWRTVAYLPAGMQVRQGEIVNLRVEDVPRYPQGAWNPVVSRADAFAFPGTSRAYRFVPDWREKGLAHNFERIPLDADRRGLFDIVFGDYLIKCDARR